MQRSALIASARARNSRRRFGLAHASPTLCSLVRPLIFMVKRIAITALVIAVTGYAGLCVYLYVAQRSLLYFPTPEVVLTDAKSLRMQTAGAVLKVWQVARPGPDAVVYFGGNADDVAAHVRPFAHALPDQSLYFVNYRGFGGSTGTPTEAALFADALSVFDQIGRASCRERV